MTHNCVRLSALATAIALMACGLVEDTPAGDESSSDADPRDALYVDAEAGSDENDGFDLGHPLRTLAHAVDVARDQINESPSGLRIVLRQGTHRIDAPILLDFGGTADDRRLVIQSHLGESATLSAGRVLAGQWQALAAKPHIFSTFVGREGDGLRFRQLFVNGEQAVRARTPLLPDGGAMNRADMLACRRPSSARQPPGSTFDYQLRTFALAHRPATENAELSRIEMVSLEHWNSYRCPVTEVSADRRSFNLRPDCLELSSVRAGFEINRPSWFENAFDFIDEPGEWYHDRRSGQLYYYPRTPTEIESAEFVVPLAESLIKVEGTRAKPVAFVSIEGVRFEHTTWDRPSEHGYPSAATGIFLELCPECQATGRRGAVVPGALALRHAHDIEVRGSEFVSLAGTAVHASIGSKRISISDNNFDSIGGGAIFVGESFKPPVEEDYVEEVAITDNTVARTGLEHHDAAAVTVTFARGVNVEHNTVRNTPYTGIFIGFGNAFNAHPSLRDNQVASNRVENVMNVLVDGGGIYTTSPQSGTVLRRNFVTSLNLGLRQGDDFAVRTCRRTPATTIYLDKGSQDIAVQNNVFDRVAQLGIDDIDLVFGPRFPQESPCSFKACSITEIANRLFDPESPGDREIVEGAGRR